MEKIVINKDACIGCGLCVHSHPEYLIFDERGLAEPIGKDVLPQDKKNILVTIENCPTDAVMIEEVKEA